MDRGGTLIIGEAFVSIHYCNIFLEDRIALHTKGRVYLLRKLNHRRLGVVTALTLTLIDDELACDPFSTPQKLSWTRGAETA
eukprot:scaffold27280_cov72-Skeletonema_dohrnii-CCMP3373.AAC.1